MELGAMRRRYLLQSAHRIGHKQYIGFARCGEKLGLGYDQIADTLLQKFLDELMPVVPLACDGKEEGGWRKGRLSTVNQKMLYRRVGAGKLQCLSVRNIENLRDREHLAKV